MNEFPSSSPLPSPSSSSSSKIKRAVGVMIGIIGIIIITWMVIKGRSDPSSLPSDPLERARALHRKYPMIDGHNDLPWQFRKESFGQIWNMGDMFDLEQLQPRWNTDLVRLRQGGVGGQFWSAYVDCDMQYKDSVRGTLEQIDVILKLVNKYSDQFQIAVTADQIMEAFNNGKIASLIGVEGGHSIDSSLSTLRLFYQLGVRYMTLTHSCNTPWSDSCAAVSEHNGLSPFGEIVVKEMNRLGMIVDLAHVSATTMHHALNVSQAPVMFSHSGARALCSNERNVPDDVLLRLPANGGVVMVNFYNYFVTCNRTATIANVADHIDHIRSIAGVDHIGYGSDFDGVGNILPTNLTDVSMFPLLTAELIRRGYNDQEIIGIIGGNILRVFRQVEKVASGMKNLPPFENVLLANSTCRTWNL